MITGNDSFGAISGLSQGPNFKPMIKSLAIGAGSALVTAVVILVFQGVGFRLSPVGMSYADLAATLLSAAAVLLTIIGIFIAALAIWGFAAFRSVAKSAAKGHVSAQIRNGDLRTHIESLVKSYLGDELASGDLRLEFERRLDEVILQSAARRAVPEGTTENDVPVGDL
ncbi:hypothetical protein [Brevundimonas sp.]|uniref:hypothetical protein n=1 Tax=Brevundimonas sp. TaxID=1871086 RepID=UPI0037C128B4